MSRTAPFTPPANPFKAFVIQEGRGLPSEIEVGWPADRVARLLAAPITVVERSHDYQAYPGTAWPAAGSKRMLVQREILGVTAGVVDGRVDWLDFFYPMIAKTTEGAATVSTEDEVVARYGKPESTTEDAPSTWYHYPSRGVSFAIAGDHVRRIVVYARKN